MAAWLDRTRYPFQSHYVDVPDGTMHYVDEGEGHKLLMLHGTPTWSFLYRDLITHLSRTYRVVAPDHLGFGLSSKPEGYSYRPQDQTRNLAAFIDALGLRDLTLVVHDYGGPIGLAYALQHPENIRHLVLFNTWMWSLRAEPDKAVAGWVMGGAFGRWLYQRTDFEFGLLIPSVYASRAAYRAVESQYRGPFDSDFAFEIAWIQARELLASSDWYASLWAQRETLQDIPALLLWGLKDPVFGRSYLEKWQAALPDAQTQTFEDAGHFVQEEAGTAAAEHIAAFLGGQGE